jgi:ABC-type lipoprotein export system ATPase subunit
MATDPAVLERAPIVTVDNVSRRISSRGTSTVLLAPISLVLRAGTLVALAGPSGSGKTTLCNIITGWEPTDTGSVHWADGADADAAARASTWAMLSIAPQRLALLPSLNIRENLLMPFWAGRRDVPEAELAALTAALEIADLLDRRPSEVSFGEQQRAAIARAVLGAPQLAVLDEPTGHQDEVRAALVIDVFLAARTCGTCVLVATHDPDLIAAADEVVTLRSPLAAAETPVGVHG